MIFTPRTARPTGPGADRARARDGRAPAPASSANPDPSAKRSATGSSGSAPGSLRSPHSSRSGPAKGRTDSPARRSTPMTVVTHELKASFAFIERNFNLTRRYWGWEVAFLVYSVAGALSISLIGASQDNEELLLSLMIGAIFWNYLSVVFSLDRRDDHHRALGRHPRVHDDGADPALVAAARVGRLRDGLRPRSTRRSSSSCSSCSSRSWTCPARTRRPSSRSCCSARSASSGSG